MKYVKLFEEFEEDKWWKKYTKYQLSAYPTNVPEDKVKIDLTGDIDTHPVMTWDSPTTGKKIYAYTKARMDAQKEKKYERIEGMSDEQIERIKVKCHETLTGNESDDLKQAAAIVSIIAQTGLRPGSIQGFEKTKNRGVMTLSPDNIEIYGSKIKLNFTGKSYKDNTAEIDDGVLAHYIEQKLPKSKDFVFDISKSSVEDYYKKTLNMGKFKIKDLRTFIANKIAKYFLEHDPSLPPPVPKNPSEIKRLIKTKLKHAFEVVSKKLNNSPAMAKSSYVDPEIIEDWLKDLGIEQKILVAEEENIESHEEKTIGNAPIYKLPKWWDSDDIELINIKK